MKAQLRASKYVVGLLFDPNGETVALIEKDHPEWQAGKLNGLGGKVEPGEDVWQAISREVQEEGGVLVHPHEWEIFLVLEGEEYSATFLRAFSPEVANVRTCTSERVNVFRVGSYPLPTIPNLGWIVPLALDRDLATPVRVYDNNIAGAEVSR